MPLLLRSRCIFRQDGIDVPGERVELRTHWRPAPPVSGRHRKRQHLRHRLRVDPITTRRFPLTDTLNLYRVTNLSIKPHALHPPPLPLADKGYLLPDLYSGDRTARPFSEGFSLRRLHLLEKPAPRAGFRLAQVVFPSLHASTAHKARVPAPL